MLTNYFNLVGSFAMHFTELHSTLVLSSRDVQAIALEVGLDTLMDRLIQRLSSLMQSFDEVQTAIPIRSGFNYHLPHTGLVEWMPLHQKGEQVTIKVVGYHPQNPQRYQVPTILSTISAYDVRTGHLRALMDGVFLTALRTGAASAVASRLLALPQSKTLGLIGCGAQAVTQLHALSRIFDFDRICFYDVDPQAASTFTNRCAAFELSATFEASSIEQIVNQSDIICTATSLDVGQGPLFDQLSSQEHLHVNAVGADFPGKTELPLSLLQESFVCPDFRDQAIKEGECQQLKAEEIGADILTVIKQAQAFQPYHNQRTVYDSTGWALQDYAVMQLFIEHATDLGVGQRIPIENIQQDAKNPYEFYHVPIAK
ncbi:MAG: ornithine cyclodeaminase family protein [Bacteroidota bacterium]